MLSIHPQLRVRCYFLPLIFKANICATYCNACIASCLSRAGVSACVGTAPGNAKPLHGELRGGFVAGVSSQLLQVDRSFLCCNWGNNSLPWIWANMENKGWLALARRSLLYANVEFDSPMIFQMFWEGVQWKGVLLPRGKHIASASFQLTATACAFQHGFIAPEVSIVWRWRRLVIIKEL